MSFPAAAGAVPGRRGSHGNQFAAKNVYRVGGIRNKSNMGKGCSGLRKAVAALLVLFILGGSVSAGLAQDYHRQVLEYLAAKLQVAEEEIQLQGELKELPYSGEKLWLGRYSIKEAVEGASDDPAAGQEEGYDEGKPEDLDGSVSSGPLAGTVVLRVKTGEILTAEEAAFLWEEEQQLEQKELERLEKEAGVISPYLYRQLNSASPEQKFKVTIWLKYVETAAMRKAMEELYREYPEFPGGEVPPSSGRKEPVVDGGTAPAGVGGGVSGGRAEPYPPPADGAGGGVEPAPAGDDAAFTILPYPRDKEAAENPVEERVVPPKEAPDAVDREEIDWKRFEEMQQRLAEIRLQGYQENLARLKSDLDSMNVEYEVLGGGVAVACEMTAAQILSLKDKDYIDSIGEELDVTPDGPEPALAGDLLQEIDKGAATGGSPVGWILAAAVLLFAAAGAGVVVYKRRRAVNEQ